MLIFFEVYYVHIFVINFRSQKRGRQNVQNSEDILRSQEKDGSVPLGMSGGAVGGGCADKAKAPRTHQLKMRLRPKNRYKIQHIFT